MNVDCWHNSHAAALLMVDFINDIVVEGGKLAGKGYAQFIQHNQTQEKIQSLLESARRLTIPVIHVRVGFAQSYDNHPGQSPLFGAAKKFGALALGTWGTEFAEFARPTAQELMLNKPRVSAFFGTNLETVLRSQGIQNIFIAGCATDLAVQSAARDAHDRDFSVFVVQDACAAANAADHENSLITLQKISCICTVDELLR